MKLQTLAELQNSLQDFLLGKISDASALTLATPSFSREARLEIYHQAYRLRLIDALRNDYPALQTYLGEDNFAALAMEFIATNPSHNPSLRWFGEKLPHFLKDHAEHQNHIEIVELAKFEWAQAMAFDAADVATATLGDVRMLKPEQWMEMQLGFHPSVQRLNCHSNAPIVWNSLIKDQTEIAGDISAIAQDWLVWRENLQVVYRPLDKPEAYALDSFLQNQNFADVCAKLYEWYDEEQIPIKAAQYLQRWISSGLVVKISALDEMIV